MLDIQTELQYYYLSVAGNWFETRTRQSLLAQPELSSLGHEVSPAREQIKNISLINKERCSRKRKHPCNRASAKAQRVWQRFSCSAVSCHQAATSQSNGSPDCSKLKVTVTKNITVYSPSSNSGGRSVFSSGSKKHLCFKVIIITLMKEFI